MQTEKSLYDYSNLELKEKLQNDFEERYSKLNYTPENWEIMNSILEQFNEEILQTNFPYALYNETSRKLGAVESIKKDVSPAVKIFDNILKGLSKVGRGIAIVYKSIKFVFSIFAITFASVIITEFLHLIAGTFIYAILPSFVTPMMFKSILAGLLFIIFKSYILLDLDENIEVDDKTELIKFIITIPFYALVFLIFLKLDQYPRLENIIPAFYPHMWMSNFTNEYVFSPMFALTINCLIPIAIYLIIKRKTNK